MGRPRRHALLLLYETQTRERGANAFEELCYCPLSRAIPSGWRPCCSAGQMGLTGPLSSRGQVAVLNRQRQGDPRDRKKQHRKSNVRNSLTCDGQLRQSNFCGDLIRMDLWYWLINHSVFGHDINRKPAEFLFDLC